MDDPADRYIPSSKPKDNAESVYHFQSNAAIQIAPVTLAPFGREQQGPVNRVADIQGPPHLVCYLHAGVEALYCFA